MSLTQFAIPPDQATYSVKDGKEVVATKLDGGAARYRRDILGSTSRVSVQWTVGPEKYRYIRSFFRAIVESGSLPFNIDLILDDIYLTTHKSYFVPDSMTLVSQMGLTYVVTAELEVCPAPVSIYAVDYVTFYNEFEDYFRLYESMLNDIMNAAFPEVL